MSTITAPIETAGDTKVIGLIGAAHFVSHFLQLSLPPLLPVLKSEFNVSFTELGLVVTVFYIASALGQATAGVLVDRYGAYRLLVAGLSTLAVAIAAIGLATQYWMLLPLAALAGLGNSVFHPADLSILSHRVRHSRVGRAYAVHGVAGSLGFVASPLLIGEVAILSTWRIALVAAACLGLAIAVLLWANRAALSYALHHEAQAHPSQKKPGFFTALGSPVVLLAFAYFAMTSFAGTGIQTFSVTAFTTGYGLPLRIATWGLTAYLIGSTCGMLAGGFLADRTENHHRVAMIGISVVAALMLLIASQPAFGVEIVALLFAAGAAGGVTSPSRDVLIRRAAAAARAGTGSVFGLVYSGFDIGSSIAPLLFGFLVDQHATHAVFLTIACGFALAVPTVLQVRHRARPPAAAVPAGAE
jgi:FSR family fosmidomycin resistance protein-like MFS transporter